MADSSHKPAPEVPYQFGVPIEPWLERREHFADRYSYDFGQERVFPELVKALLEVVPADANVLEVGAATGLLTEPLLTRAGHLTALEPSEGMLRRLLAKRVADAPNLRVRKGMAEDLAYNELFECAVVTFTPRRGVGLLTLLQELALRVTSSVIMLIDDDATTDWAHLARAATRQGFGVEIRLVSETSVAELELRRHAVLLVASVEHWTPTLPAAELWEFDARTIDVPFPPPRGTATRLVRYFLAGGDRALVISTESQGLERLYGNLRTAAHRLGRDEVTVRRTDESVQLVRLPKANE